MTKRYQVYFVLILIFAFAASATAEVRLLAPPEGYVSRQGIVWAVVQSSDVPEVRLDGTPQTGILTEGNIHHIKIAVTRREGSRLSVRTGDGAVERTVFRFPGGAERPRFHGVKDPECLECHERNKDTCLKCHVFPEHKHVDQLGRRCLTCHDKPDLTPIDLARACARCHKKFTIKTHPKLKHSLAGGNDPNRPGMALDCASCHDPHTPLRLSDMDRIELREWCRDCHSKP